MIYEKILRHLRTNFIHLFIIVLIFEVLFRCFYFHCFELVLVYSQQNSSTLRFPSQISWGMPVSQYSSQNSPCILVDPSSAHVSVRIHLSSYILCPVHCLFAPLGISAAPNWPCLCGVDICNPKAWSWWIRISSRISPTICASWNPWEDVALWWCFVWSPTCCCMGQMRLWWWKHLEVTDISCCSELISYHTKSNSNKFILLRKFCIQLLKTLKPQWKLFRKKKNVNRKTIFFYKKKIIEKFINWIKITFIN